MSDTALASTKENAVEVKVRQFVQFDHEQCGETTLGSLVISQTAQAEISADAVCSILDFGGLSPCSKIFQIS